MLLDEQEKTVLAETSNVAMAKETRISIEIEKLQKLLESVNTCRSLVGLASKEYSDMQLLSIADTLQNKINSLNAQCKSTLFSVCETPDEIVLRVKTDEIHRVLSDIVTVKDSTQLFRNATAVLPYLRLGIHAKMNVIVTLDMTDDGEFVGDKLVIANLTSGAKMFLCPVSDNKDGTYSVTVIPQQLGQHQLSITINNQHIQNSLFNLSVIQKKNYVPNLRDPIEVFASVQSPLCIAFSDDEIFVTSVSNHIYVFDSNGKNKFSIDLVQLQEPYGIDVIGDIIFVAQYKGQNILKLTTKGEFLDSFGKKGSGIGQFRCPTNIKIGPDRKIYVCDTENNRIQIFYPDFSIFHVICSGDIPARSVLLLPFGLCFDLVGYIHITWFNSSLVTVHTLKGQHVRHYDESRTKFATTVVCDTSGNTIVDCYEGISIFDPSGRFIRWIGGFSRSHGLSVSPNNGSLWIADTGNDRIIKCRY